MEFSEALAHFEDLITRVEGGEAITITRGLVPVAELCPFGQARPPGLRPWGLAKGEFTVPDDFNDPLPDDLLDLFEGKGDDDK